jgi:NAD(P)-dependent dehydrogenase (short-subunit alcohol dehydrogenase family)
MSRLHKKVAIIVGAGQTPGTTVGNGRAVAHRFAAEGALVLAVDREMTRAAETAETIRKEGGTCIAFAADICDEAAIKSIVAKCLEAFGRIDILHNNVGVSIAGGDAPIETITSEAFDRIHAINLRGMALTCKHVLPLFRAQRSGVIVNVSSAAAVALYPNLAYKTSKAAVIALTQSIAVGYAEFGVRANCILPGLLDTPMAIEARSDGTEESRSAIRANRDAQVPLRGRMGTAWDVASAALFLASDESGFITGINLPVDGGALARVGT